MSQTQAAQIGRELAVSQKTAQFEIIQRFMSASEFKAFLKTYRESRRTKFSTNREENMNKEVTKKEMVILKDFFNTENSVKDVAEKHGFKPASFDYQVSKICRRLVFQNRESYGL